MMTRPRQAASVLHATVALIVAAIMWQDPVESAFVTPSSSSSRRLSPALLACSRLKYDTKLSATNLEPQTFSESVEDENDPMKQLAKRTQVKHRLLEAVTEYQQMREGIEKERLEQMEKLEEEQIKKETEHESSKYVVKLLGRIVRKILRRRKKRGGAKDIINARTLGTRTIEIGEAGASVIALAEELSKLNPTPIPTYGWKNYGGGDPTECKLDGTWKLLFTTAADATFPSSPSRGKAITSQDIDAKAGTLTNVVDFERGKLKGFRVVVAGEATSDTAIDLTFRRVVILRNSKFPRLFGRLIFPIPAGLFRLVNRYFSKGRAKNSRGPYFELQYLDEDLRMHKTGDDNWFIQRRLK